ncbi:MAG: hypothetical protein JOY71_31190 [Acetobacteraceae bacterium]|nr:hypothetical protein [Acetobacteraceae bacterium]
MFNAIRTAILLSSPVYLWLNGASAAICPSAMEAAYNTLSGIGTASSCTFNDNGTNLIIYSNPTTTIYNIVDNSVNLQLGDTTGARIHIDSAPITRIEDIVFNNINVQIGALVGPLTIFIESDPTTIVNNIVTNAVNVDMDASAGPVPGDFIESDPETMIYNVIDNSASVSSPSLQNDPSAVIEPGSLTLLGIAVTALGLFRRRIQKKNCTVRRVSTVCSLN